MAEKTRKPGRPRKKIPKKLIEEYIKIGLPVRKIAGLINVDEKTIRNNFSAELQKRKHKKIIELYEKKEKLKQAQWESAIMDKNTTMMIWLGRNYLGQKEKIENKEQYKIELIVKDLKDNKGNGKEN